MRPNLRLVWLGTQGELRNPAFRLLGIVLFLGTLAYAWNQGPLAPSTAMLLTGWAGRGFALACCLWFATAAMRDQDAHLGAVLRSKPVDGGRWVLITWATGVAVWLTLLACVFLGAMIGQLPASGLTSIGAHGLGFFRAAVVMIPLATVAFALSRVTRSPLGGTVIVLAFLCALGGLQFMPAFLRPDYTQNLPLYLGVAMVALVLAGFIVERWRRGELRRPLAPVLGLLGSLALAWGGAAAARKAAEPPPEGSVPDMMSHQFLDAEKRMPGFWLPDGRGGTVRTAAHAGKILLVYVFTPDDIEAARTLPALDRLNRELGSRGVQALGVCLSTDRGDGTTLAWTGGYGFPIGSDPNTIKTSPPPEGNVATAFNPQMLPMLVVTDRRRRARAILQDASFTMERLRTEIDARLAEEPE